MINWAKLGEAAAQGAVLFCLALEPERAGAQCHDLLPAIYFWAHFISTFCA